MSGGYLDSRLHQDSVLVQYLLSTRCVRDLEHGDSFDCLGHFDGTWIFNESLQEEVAVSWSMEESAQIAAGFYVALI